MPMKKTLRTVGRVEYDERKLTTVNIKVEGWIEKLYADYTGKYVKKGTPLAEIYSPELMSVQLEYLNLVAMQSNWGFRSQRNVEFSWGDRYGTVGRVTTNDPEGLFKVAKQKLSLWEITDEQVKEIETSKKPIKTLTVKSPASGYVFQKPVFKGTRVAPGDKIFDVVDLSTVWVLADIYEYEIPFVKTGQKAKITLSYYPQKEFSSKVDFVYPSLSGQTRTAKARFVIPTNLLLKPQMFADRRQYGTFRHAVHQRHRTPPRDWCDAGGGRFSRDVNSVFTGESLMLELISWLLALPIGLSAGPTFVVTLGKVIDFPAEYYPATHGVWIWLGIVIVLSFIASWIPAHRATRISVNESLAYE